MFIPICDEVMITFELKQSPCEWLFIGDNDDLAANLLSGTKPGTFIAAVVLQEGPGRKAQPLVWC